jgi:CheY-like chemotaxis protein
MLPLALVVENDGNTQKLLTAILQRRGFAVDTAADGRCAQLLVHNVPYALVLLDLFLPGMSGIEILGTLAAESAEALSRIIVLSAAPRLNFDEVRAVTPDVPMLRKPFDIDELGALIDEIQESNPWHELSTSDDFARRSILLGAQAATIATLDPAGARLDYTWSFGYGDEQARRYFPIDVQSPYPMCTAVRNGRGVWLASIASAKEEFPMITSLLRDSTSAIAAVPLMRDSTVAGVAGWSFANAQRFDEAEQNSLREVAAEMANDLFGHAASPPS